MNINTAPDVINRSTIDITPGYMSGLRQRLRDRGAARRAADRPQLAAAVRLRPLCRAAVRLAVHGAARQPTSAPGSTASARRCSTPAASTKADAGLWRTAPCHEPTCRSASCAGTRCRSRRRQLTFLEGVRTMTTAGDVNTQAGMAAHVYLVTASMEDEYFYNADGEMLFVPQQGELRFFTEFGIIDVEPGEIASSRAASSSGSSWSTARRAATCARTTAAPSRCPSAARSAPTASPTRATS